MTGPEQFAFESRMERKLPADYQNESLYLHLSGGEVVTNKISRGLRILVAFSALSGWQTKAAPLADPPAVLPQHSAASAFDLLIVARPKTQVLGTMKPTLWVYSVCQRQLGTDNCAGNSRPFDNYGGVRINAMPGDTLNIRLINQLPPFVGSLTSANLLPKQDPRHDSSSACASATGMMQEMCAMALGDNPTNLHTHGLTVRPTDFNPYGDYIFVDNYRSANTVEPIPGQLVGVGNGDLRKDAVDYQSKSQIPIPTGSFGFIRIFMASL